MTPRKRMETAMRGQRPDRVPVWCLLSAEHIIRNGTPDGQVPRSIEQFVAAECELTRRYLFDGLVLYLPGEKKGARVDSTIEGWLATTPHGEGSHILGEADPESWEYEPQSYGPEDFHAAFLARETLGEDYHIGGWTPDGFSHAIQWFPDIEEAMIAILQEPQRFKALVEYFDRQSVHWAKAQVELGRLESMHISSPYAGSSFISPKSYRELVLSSVRKLADALKPTPAFTYLHTCGFLSDRLELLVETGVDGIECMDPPPLGDVELSEAKKRIGGKIFLKGNIDSVNVLLRGSDEQVDGAIMGCLESGMPGGGYILSTACSVAPPVPPRRVRRLGELAQRFGEYRQ